MKILLTSEQLQEGVERLAAEIAHNYRGRPLTVIGVLTGSVVVLADLIRHLDFPLKIGFVQARSYRGCATSPGPLTVNTDLMPDIKGQDVLILDDIFDTGHTLDELIRQLSAHEPNSLRSAVLLRKHGRKAVAMEPDHVGFEIPDTFVVGYGLDYHDDYRHLPHLAALEDAEIIVEDSAL